MVKALSNNCSYSYYSRSKFYILSLLVWVNNCG